MYPRSLECLPPWCESTSHQERFVLNMMGLVMYSPIVYIDCVLGISVVQYRSSGGGRGGSSLQEENSVLKYMRAIGEGMMYQGTPKPDCI